MEPKAENWSFYYIGSIKLRGNFFWFFELFYLTLLICEKKSFLKNSHFWEKTWNFCNFLLNVSKMWEKDFEYFKHYLHIFPPQL